MTLYLLLLQPLDDILNVSLGSDGAPRAEPVVPLLVLPLLAKLGEYFFEEFSRPRFLLLSLLRVFNLFNLKLFLNQLDLA